MMITTILKIPRSMGSRCYLESLLNLVSFELLYGVLFERLSSSGEMATGGGREARWFGMRPAQNGRRLARLVCSAAGSAASSAVPAAQLAGASTTIGQLSPALVPVCGHRPSAQV